MATTVTGLNAADAVQLDLPAEGDTPARRIRAATLSATGAEGAGLQNAVFTGNVDFHESRAAKKDVAAIERTARSQRLDVQTKPGFGRRRARRLPWQRPFHRWRRDDRRCATAIYAVSQDRLELSPSTTRSGQGSTCRQRTHHRGRGRTFR